MTYSNTWTEYCNVMRTAVTYESPWFRWSVQYGDRLQGGCAKELSTALDDIRNASANIVKTPYNPRRNP